MQFIEHPILNVCARTDRFARDGVRLLELSVQLGALRSQFS